VSLKENKMTDNIDEMHATLTELRVKIKDLSVANKKNDINTTLLIKEYAAKLDEIMDMYKSELLDDSNPLNIVYGAKQDELFNLYKECLNEVFVTKKSIIK